MSSVTQTQRTESPARIAAGRSVSSERAASCFKRPLTASEGSERVASATARALAAAEEEIAQLRAKCTALAGRIITLAVTLRTKEALYEQEKKANAGLREEVTVLTEQVRELTEANTTLLAEKKKVGEKLHSVAMKLPPNLLAQFVGWIAEDPMVVYIVTVEAIVKEHFGTSRY